jgi:hypothetical protein
MVMRADSPRRIRNAHQQNMSTTSSPKGPAERVERLASADSGWRRGTLVCMLCGGAALALGLLVYWIDRHPRTPSPMPFAGHVAPLHAFGALGGWLPDLVHPLAFSLFCAALMPRRPVPAYGACIAWFVVNVMFEIGQHPSISPTLAAALQPVPVLGRWLAGYFVRGTFDPGDIVAAAMGSVLAAAILHLFVLEKGHALTLG